MTAAVDVTDAPAPERVVLLGDDGGSIGTALKSGVHHASTPLHLGFSCYLFDASGHFVLTRRAHDKWTFPGVLTNSFCGHPFPGESLVEAVRRRAHAELGVAPADVTDIRLILADFAYRAEMNQVVENERCPVLVAHLRDGASVRPNPAEVGSLDHVEWRAFATEVLAGQLAVSPWCRDQVAVLDTLGPDHEGWPDAAIAGLPEAVRLSD